MPLYEYECKKCGHRFEKILKFSDKPMKKCPDCGGAVEQLISAATVQFKGAGWYVTDYAKKGSTSSAKSSDGEGGSKDTTKDKESKDSKESRDSKDSKETKKEEKPKTESSTKKQRKD
jgi:putative FmdB family regulatory protein